jgi:ribosomal protein S27E
MILHNDHQWTTIQCTNCEDCHKVLNDKFMRAVLCPYCGTTLMLEKGKVPVVNGSTEAINRIAAERRVETPVGHSFYR